MNLVPNNEVKGQIARTNMAILVQVTKTIGIDQHWLGIGQRSSVLMRDMTRGWSFWYPLL